MRTYKLILKGIDFLDFPETITKQSYSLIRKLCRENPEDRLGANRGLSEIKRHKLVNTTSNVYDFLGFKACLI